MSASLVERPETLRVGEKETLHFRLTNQAGMSPFNFGLGVAYDTALFARAGHQVELSHGLSGSGNHVALSWFRDGYSLTPLRQGEGVDHWYVLTPKVTGRLPILLRSWSADRLFPGSGAVLDVSDPSWRAETLTVK
jgi:hypothetical protein